MKYVSMLDYLMGRAKLLDLPDELAKNAAITVTRTNTLLEAFGQYRTVTSGYRRPEDNAKVPNPKPKSKHLTCEAIDLFDKDGKLYDFCISHPEVLERIGLWAETRQGPWLHCQIRAPKSGKRFFLP